MDSAEFHAAVYHVVRQIPPQKVTSYSHIAKLIGMPRHSRHVGQALKYLSPNTTPPVPWHRVISAAGVISSRGPGTDGAQRQRQTLEAEGVEVTQGRSGDLRVNFGAWGWFPAVGSIDLGEHGGAQGSEGEDDE
ncbi:DNA binding methylated-DNA-cysteine S-methyltransferase, partial [Leucogyrophana mollusca]